MLARGQNTLMYEHISYENLKQMVMLKSCITRKRLLFHCHWTVLHSCLWFTWINCSMVYSECVTFVPHLMHVSNNTLRSCSPMASVTPFSVSDIAQFPDWQNWMFYFLCSQHVAWLELNGLKVEQQMRASLLNKNWHFADLHYSLHLLIKTSHNFCKFHRHHRQKYFPDSFIAMKSSIPEPAAMQDGNVPWSCHSSSNKSVSSCAKTVKATNRIHATVSTNVSRFQFQLPFYLHHDDRFVVTACSIFL